MSETVPIYGFGGGGAALNFDVKQYTTESQLSAARPKENTIGVITTTAITNWYFAAEQPENMVNGDVWFPTGTSSTVAFNALKKNAVQVYPLSAKQMVSGALVDKIAKSYQGGKWVDLSLYLFKDGNQYDDITGGWEQIAVEGKKHGTVTFSGGDIVLTAKNDQNAEVTAAACKSFDGRKLAGKNSLRIIVSERTAYSSFVSIVIRIYDTTSLTTKLAEVYIPNKGEYTLPLGGIDSGQVVLMAYMGTLSVSEIEVV